MTVKRSGLGRNLSALLGNASSATQSYKMHAEPTHLPYHALQPGKYQPRKDIEEGALSELAASIKQQGLLQPILVRELDEGRYEILAGERRWRASQLAGLENIPVIIKQVDDQTAMAIALVENLQREDLNAMDQARAMHRLTTEFGLTHQKVADLLNKSRTAVSNFMRLLTLNSEVRRLLENADLDMGHARALLMLDEAQQLEVAKLVVADELSVRETEKLVNRIKKGPLPTKLRLEIQPQFRQQIENLTQTLQTKIALKPGKQGKGTLVIHYANDANLQMMLDRLGK